MPHDVTPTCMARWMCVCVCKCVCVCVCVLVCMCVCKCVCVCVSVYVCVCAGGCRPCHAHGMHAQLALTVQKRLGAVAGVHGGVMHDCDGYSFFAWRCNAACAVTQHTHALCFLCQGCYLSEPDVHALLTLAACARRGRSP